MEKYSDWDAGLEAHFAACTPAWAAGVTGLTEAEIVAFARLYGETKRSYIRVGYGFSRARNGSSSVHAVACLPTVTGAWQYRGGGAMQAQSDVRSEEHTSELQSLMRISYAVFCLKKKKHKKKKQQLEADAQI